MLAAKIADGRSFNFKNAFICSAPGEFPITKEKVTLKVFYAPASYITDMVDNEATKWLEQKTNITVDWMLVSASDAATRINLLLAANAEKDMPDVFLTDMGRAQVEKYGSDGVLLPLNSYLDQYSVNYKDLFAYNDKLQKQMTAFDGNIYFLPKYWETTHMRHQQRLWMNTKWLENVDMKTPTTIDEFYNVLEAFKEKDANGNGDASDEIPYLCFTDGGASTIDSFVMNSFVYSPFTGEKFYLEDGKVTASYVQDGWREGLRFNKKLYDEGLLDPECFTMTSEQVLALSSDPKGTRIGSVAASISPQFVDTSSEEAFNYVSVAPLKGPDGVQQSPLDLYNPTPFFVITSYCKIPEIAFRWADCMATDIAANLKNDGYEWMNLWYGTEGETGAWEKAKDGDVGFSGEKAYYKQLFTWGDKLNNHWYENFLINMKADWKTMGAFENTGGYNLEKVLYDSSVNLSEPVSVDKTLPTLSFSPQEAEESSELITNLTSYYRESMTKFVRGEMDLDNDWDGYLKELDNIGLQRAIELYQTAYDRTFK